MSTSWDNKDQQFGEKTPLLRYDAQCKGLSKPCFLHQHLLRQQKKKMSRHSVSDRAYERISDILRRKSGHIRKHLCGKRVNQEARTVLGVAISLKIDQVGISKDIYRALTKPMVVNSWNYNLAEKLIREKSVNYVKKGERKISLKFHMPVIVIGDILYVHLIKGDWVVMKRQPTLHQPSMMGFWVVPQEVKTFKVSLPVTKPLNADFDRDEMNCHVPQNPMATTEVKELMATLLHIVSPKNGMPVICILQDAMVSMYLLTRERTRSKDQLGYTGKDLFSFLLLR